MTLPQIVLARLIDATCIAAAFGLWWLTPWSLVVTIPGLAVLANGRFCDWLEWRDARNRKQGDGE